MIGYKGVSPLVSSVILMLMAVSLAAIVWGFMNEYWTQRTNTATTTAKDLVYCSEGGIKITSCNYTASLQKVELKVENTGSKDLSSFWVNVQYSNGSATQVKSDKNILAGQTVTIDGNALFTPAKVKVQSVECAEVNDSTTDCS